MFYEVIFVSKSNIQRANHLTKYSNYNLYWLQQILW